MSSSPNPASELAQGLRSLGLGQGDRVVVHSSLRRVGTPHGSASTVLSSLLEVVGDSGLVMVPTFTYDSSRFDPRTTPSRTGALAEELRQHAGARRSLHPFYSVAAAGSDTEALLAGHEDEPGTSVRSPLGRLASQGGLVLLLGVGHIANTTIHVGEFAADAPYLDIPFDPDWPSSAEILLADGKTLQRQYDRFAGCSRAFGAIERMLRQRGNIRDGMVGRAASQLVRAADVIAVTAALLAENSGALLCTDDSCFRCARARSRISRDARDRAAEADPAR